MPEKILGLDIGAGSVKAVILSRGFRGGRRILAVRRIEIHEPGGIPEALARLFVDQVFRGAICVTALPPGLLSFRNVRLPFRDNKKIGQTLAFALEPLIQQPLDGVFIDYRVTARGEQSEIFAALADRPLVGERTALLSPYVRDTAVIDIDAVPLASLLQRPGFPACALLLDIGVRDATAIFAGEGRILHIRHFHFGGETATGAIAEALRIDSTAAEALKQSGELPGIGGGGRPGGLRPVFLRAEKYPGLSSGSREDPRGALPDHPDRRRRPDAGDCRGALPALCRCGGTNEPDGVRRF